MHLPRESADIQELRRLFHVGFGATRNVHYFCPVFKEQGRRSGSFGLLCRSPRCLSALRRLSQFRVSFWLLLLRGAGVNSLPANRVNDFFSRRYFFFSGRLAVEEEALEDFRINLSLASLWPRLLRCHC